MKKIFTFILALCMILTVVACTYQENTPAENTTPQSTTPENTTPDSTTPDGPTSEMTLQEVYDAGKNLLALLGDHENVYARITSEGKVIREEYLSKQYAYSYYSADFMNIGFDYANFATDNTSYLCYDNVYAFNVTLRPDGIVETPGLLALAGESTFISSAVLNDEVTIVEENGFIIVTCIMNVEDLLFTGENVVSCVETYTLDAKTREMVSIKTVYTYEDGTVEEGVVTITRDIEEPESMKPFLEFVQETTEMRTVTIVSNPGTENEKTESLQVPKGLPFAIGSDWDVEEMYTIYEDAACTQPSEEMWDMNTDITIYVKWEEYIPEIDVTLEEIQAANKDYLALLGDHENVFIVYEYSGAGRREDYYSKEHYHSFIENDYYGWNGDYETFLTENAEYYYFEGAYSFDITLTLDGMINAKENFDKAGKTPFMEFDATKEENATLVQQDGLLILTYTYDQEGLAEFGDNIVSLVETYTMDATTLEIISATVCYTYDDGTITDGVVTVSRDVEAPARVKEFLKFENETENLRTVTVVSNPGTENEKIETVQAPKGLPVDIYSSWEIKETLILYTDAACTQVFEGDTDLNADITVYAKWEKVRYTVTQEEWDAAVVEDNFTIERIENGETYTFQKYTDYALDVDGEVFLFIGDKTYALVEEADGWVAYDRTYLQITPSTLLPGCDMVDFEYDEQEQAYIYKYWEDYGYTVALRFENGLPVSMTLVNIEDESDIIVRLFTDVGTTVIEIPDYEIKEEEENKPVPSPVTEEVWNSFVGETNFEYAIMLAGYVGSKFHSEFYSIKSTGNALEIDGVIYVLENGKYYVLEETADGWIATESQIPAYCITSLLDGMNYNDYEFSEESGYYVPKEVAENEPYNEIAFDENGNLIALFFYNNNLSEDPETEGAIIPAMLGFTNVGSAVIDVPEYTIAQ